MNDESHPATDAFGLVADETRLAILRALGSAPYAEFEGTLRFSELRERAAIRDSGKFNYHLQQLVGPFVREREDGYSLNYAGELLYRTVVAGFFTDDVNLEEFESDSPCPTCGTPFDVRYEDNRLRLACSDCGREYQDVPYPPSAVEAWDDDELLRAFDQWGRHNIVLFSRGICKWCGGPMPGEFRRVSEDWLTGDRESAVYVARTCENCRGFMYTTPGENVLDHPAVVSFFYERGIDVTRRPLWELDFVADGVHEVHSEEPWEVEVAVVSNSDELRLVLDDDIEVVEIRDEEAD